jgi:hypothetical protein
MPRQPRSPKSTPMGEKLRRDFGIMTPHELSVMLEVSEHTIVGWRNAGTGPVFTYLGRRVYYRKQDVMSWIDDGLVRKDFIEQAARAA